MASYCSKSMAALTLSAGCFLPLAGPAQADGLTQSTLYNLQEPGLAMAVGGTGLDNPGREGTISITVEGPPIAAYLYWSGAGTFPGGDDLPQQLEFGFDGTIFTGTLIGFEEEVDFSLSFRSEVTSVVTDAFLDHGGPGTFLFDVVDPNPDDNLDRMHGAGLVVLYTDPTDLNSEYRVLGFDGADYAFANASSPGTMTTKPISFMYDPTLQPRTADLGLLVGEGENGRPDVVEVRDAQGTTAYEDILDGSDGPRFDSELLPVTIEPGVDSTEVEIISPDGDPPGDSFVWQLAVMRIEVPGGACCFPDGKCVEMLEMSCQNAGGIYQGDETVCDPNPCEPITGACCFPNGNCTVMQESNCVNGGGVYQGDGTDCDPNPCPQPVGACCLTDFTCQDLTEAACDALSGDWQGAGSSCDMAGVCPDPTGACCLTSGDCVETTQDNCESDLNGQYQGDGVTCDAVECPEPPKLGRCCFLTDQGVECLQLTEADCFAADVDGYDWLEGGNCTQNPCPEPGACCLSDGTCIKVEDADDCTAQGGIFQGILTSCDDAGFVCEPIGACCFKDGTCDDLIEVACNSAGGFWQGPDTECVTADCPVPACCLPDGSCQLLTAGECLAAGGEPHLGVYDCAEVECGFACCLPDGSCVNTDQQDCEDILGGTFHKGLQCDEVACPQACCLPDNTCIMLTPDDCTAQGGTPQGDGTTCDTVECPQPCCLPDNTCIEILPADCTAQGGTPQGEGLTCATVVCPEACCLPDGTCVSLLPADCAAQGGTPQGMGTTCSDVDCTRACCLPDGTCIDTTLAECEDQNGIFDSEVQCADGPPCLDGACCLPDGSCQSDLTLGDCEMMNGTWQGPATDCGEVICAPPTTDVRGCVSTKGSLVVFSKVELRWDAAGNLIQDTFLHLTNDYPDDVQVQMYFINGDPPLPADPNIGERAHPGWNWYDNAMTLTGNQPVSWSVATGNPVGLAPFTTLDPADGGLPGRPAMDGTGERVLRGFVLAWAVNAQNEEIRWNHLAGLATLVNYADDYAWEYVPCSYPVVDEAIANGEPSGTPGQLQLDGNEYAQAFDQLLMQFTAAYASRFSHDQLATVSNQTDLTLHPIEADLRQETEGPVTTKAHIDIWNENEIKFSGAHRCITCWDQTLLRDYGTPNHFLIGALQTDIGKARIDGVASGECDRDFDHDGVLDLVSEDAALLGVQAKLLEINGDLTAAAGSELQGMGYESASIRYDVLQPPPELSGPEGEGQRVIRTMLKLLEVGTGKEPVPPLEIQE